MILNASAENGSSSAARRDPGVSLLGVDAAAPAATSTGDGRKSTTASSSGCTPLFLKAEPHDAPAPPCSAIVARRSAGAQLVGGRLVAGDELGHDRVVDFGDRFDHAGRARRLRVGEQVAVDGDRRRTWRRALRRARGSSSSRRGRRRRGRRPRRRPASGWRSGWRRGAARICATQLSKSAPTRSILLTKAMRGTR